MAKRAAILVELLPLLEEDRVDRRLSSGRWGDDQRETQHNNLHHQTVSPNAWRHR